MMKILITGGTGFVGQHVISKLQDHNELLVISRRPVTNSKNLKYVHGNLDEISEIEKTVFDFKPAVAIHMAWQGIPDYSSKNSIKNLENSIKFYKTAIKAGCRKIIGTGSCWEYGIFQGELKEGMALKEFNAFSAAKKADCLIGKALAQEFNVDFIWLRLFFVYGPGQRLASLIPYIIQTVQEGKTPEIKNPDTQNDFVYVKDVAVAVERFVNKEDCRGIYNICTGKPIKIKDVVNEVMQQLSLATGGRAVGGSGDGDENKFWGSTQKTKSEVHWEAKTSMQDGIRQMIACSR